MKAFLDFEEINLPDYIIFLDWEIHGKSFPKNLRTTGDTLNQDFPDHENCTPCYRAYSQIAFPRETQSETSDSAIKNSDIENLINKKIDKIIDSLPKNETKQEINQSSTTIDTEEITQNIINSENKILDNKTNNITENINNFESNLKFISDNTNIQNIIEQKNIQSKNIDTQTVIELEKILSANENVKVSSNDLRLAEQNIRKENKENIEMIKNKINEQKKYIEDFLNS